MDVLIVDDNPVNLTVMEHLVGRVDGATARAFRLGEPGLAWCREHGADLVIVDYHLPDLDGLRFIERIRNLAGHEDVPVLMITANTDREVRRQALEWGTTDFLHKPVDRAEFTARVRNMLRLRALSRRPDPRDAPAEPASASSSPASDPTEVEALRCLARAAERRDPAAGSHVIRPGDVARAIAARLGRDREFQSLIRWAAPLLDVGKIGTPDSVLLKPSGLSAQELEVMRQHTVVGWEMLRVYRSPVLQMAASIALSHHERWDGGGYPKRLAGEAIPLEARIVAVVDALDTLTTVRPGKPECPVADAVASIRPNAGRHFDPDCVEALVDVLPQLERQREPQHA